MDRKYEIEITMEDSFENTLNKKKHKFTRKKPKKKQYTSKQEENKKSVEKDKRKKPKIASQFILIRLSEK